MSKALGPNDLATGNILLAEPLQDEPFFKRAAILVAEHDLKGTLGFILNKLTDVKLNDAVEDFPAFDAPLYFGGPVDTDTLFYIHTLKDLKDSKEITKGIYWGGDYDDLRFLIDTKQVTSDQIRFYAGYAGWEPEQLMDELNHNAWMLSEPKKEFVFFPTSEILWSQVLKGMKNKYSLLANFPDPDQIEFN